MCQLKRGLIEGYLLSFRENMMFGYKACICLILDSLLPGKLAEAEFVEAECL